MNELLNVLFANTIIGKPKSYENMTVFPLINQLEKKPAYVTLKKAISKSFIEISEVDEGGSVPELRVLNKSRKRILLLDGEELIGAKQNRILNASILIPRESSITIPVSCVEQGRWSYKSKKFHDSDFVMPSRMRSKKNMAVNQSLKMTKKFKSNQGQVWEDVEDLACAVSTKSKTGAMNDIYDQKKGKLNEFIQKMKIDTGQKGFVVLINGKIAGLEYISREKAFKELHRKLIRSYSLDAISDPNKTEVKAVEEQIHSFLNTIKNGKYDKFKSVGLGNDYRYSAKSFSVSALVYWKKIIHLGITFKN